jgi:hypothetical protein
MFKQYIDCITGDKRTRFCKFSDLEADVEHLDEQNNYGSPYVGNEGDNRCCYKRKTNTERPVNDSADRYREDYDEKFCRFEFHFYL